MSGFQIGKEYVQSYFVVEKPRIFWKLPMTNNWNFMIMPINWFLKSEVKLQQHLKIPSDDPAVMMKYLTETTQKGGDPSWRIRYLSIPEKSHWATIYIFSWTSLFVVFI